MSASLRAVDDHCTVYMAADTHHHHQRAQRSQHACSSIPRAKFLRIDLRRKSNSFVCAKQTRVRIVRMLYPNAHYTFRPFCARTEAHATQTAWRRLDTHRISRSADNFARVHLCWCVARFGFFDKSSYASSTRCRHKRHTYHRCDYMDCMHKGTTFNCKQAM